MSNNPLSEFLANLQEIKRPVYIVDLSEFAPGFGVKLMWQEPDALRCAAASTLAATLAMPPTLLEPETAVDVANVVSLHIGEEGQDGPISGTRTGVMTPAEFYKSIAVSRKNPRLWSWLLSEARRLFPTYFVPTDTITQAVLALAVEKGIDRKKLETDQEVVRELALEAQKKIAAGWSPFVVATSTATLSN
jgi:hypothetical protein